MNRGKAEVYYLIHGVLSAATDAVIMEINL